MKQELKTIIEALSKHLNESDTKSKFESELVDAYMTALKMLEKVDNYELKRKEVSTPFTT